MALGGGASGRVWAWLVATRGRRCLYWHRGVGDKEAGRWPTTRRTAPWEAKLAPQTSTALRLLGKRRKCVTGVQTQASVEPTSDHGARPGHGIGGWQVRVTPVWLQGLEGGPFPIASPLLPPAGAGRGRGADLPTAAGGWKEAGPTGPAAGAVGRSRRAGSRRLLQPRDRGAEMLPAVTARSRPHSAAGASPGPTMCSAAHSGTRRRGRSRHAESRVFVMNGYGPKPASGRDAEGGGPGTPGPAGSGPPPGGRRGTELSQRWR